MNGTIVRRVRRLAVCAVSFALLSCLGAAGLQSGNVALWIEHEVAIPYGDVTLYGVLTVPPTEGPHPAVALITGAAGPEGRSGVASWTHIDHAHRFAAQGFACLRYDPPGTGRSDGERGVDALDTRAEEAVAAAEFLRTRPDVDATHVGLWGISQGGWVIAMAAAESPQEIAFLIMVSGTTVSVAEQQVYGVRTQSEAAGVVGDDLTTAVLVARLLIDWQIPEPIYREANEADLGRLEPGPWTEFAALVYGEPPEDPRQEIEQVIDILERIDQETWAGSLYLGELYIPNLRRVAPGQEAAAMEAAASSLLAGPADYFRRVACPTMALFGEDDLLVPAERSVDLLHEYFQSSGNAELTVVVFPNAGHSLNGFMPAYWEALYAWLEGLRTSWSGELP